MRERTMKRVNVYLDADSLAVLAQHRSWGKSASHVIRYALKQYEWARRKKVSPGETQGGDGPVVEYD